MRFSLKSLIKFKNFLGDSKKCEILNKVLGDFRESPKGTRIVEMEWGRLFWSTGSATRILTEKDIVGGYPK